MSLGEKVKSGYVGNTVFKEDRRKVVERLMLFALSHYWDMGGKHVYYLYSKCFPITFPQTTMH